MTHKPFNVLFLCTGNTARSILAECLLRRWGAGVFNAFSAGSFPKGQVHPLSLKLIAEQGWPTNSLRSKSWDEFAGAGAPVMDLVLTVCDQATGEVCPVWPGQPVTAHWGIPDPAAVDGSEAVRALAFQDAFRSLEQRVRILVTVPIDKLDRGALTRRVAGIGRLHPDAAEEFMS